MGLKKKSIINKKICMVDMSRTTGREGFINNNKDNNNGDSSTIENVENDKNNTLSNGTNTHNKFNLTLNS